MPNLTQYQIALLAFLGGGLLVIVVFLLTSGGGDSDDNQATGRTPTPSVTPRATATEGADVTPSSTTAPTATESAPPSATAPPPATATSPPAAPTFTPVPPSATPPPTATFTPIPTATSTSTPTPTATATATAVTGAWHGTWQTNCSPSNCGNMELTQLGNIVVGTYASGAGTIDGIVSGNRLSGTWTRGAGSGSFDFWVDDSGDNWQGNFGGTSQWCGRRAGEVYPTPCHVASWYGTWTTNCGPGNCGSMTLQQDGTEVTGTYAGGSGLISATADGLSLDGIWIRGGSGSISFNMIFGGNQFNGNFNGANMWCGYRNGAPQPVPCLN